MAILNNLIVNGAARFLNGIRTNAIHTNLIDAHDGVFKTITTTTLDAETVTTDMLKANNARVSQTLTVDGTISTNKWEAANIANIGGNFYISPTGKSDSGNITVTKTSTTTINGVSVGVYTLVVSGTFGVTSTSSTIWGTNSKVIFTGSISYPKMTGTDLTTTGKKYPLGTCDGTMSAVSTGTNTLTGFTITGVNSPALDIFFKEMGVTSISSTACSGYEMQISVYQSYYSSAQHPIGILLTSYGKEKKQYIDIYGGANAVSDSASGFAEPSVRVGQLDGLSDIRDGVTDANSPTKPSGWGIYTNNGFFKGKVVANAGIIGSGTKIWTIGNDGNNRSYIYSGVNNISSTTTEGIYVGTDGILNVSSSGTAGRPYVQITNGVITAQGAIINGQITATSGKIGSASDAINQINIGTNTTNASIYTGGHTSLAETGNGFYLGSDGLSIGSGFKVTNAGVLSATGADLTGKVSATSGSIGGWQIGTDTNKSLHNGSANTSPTPAANVVILSKGITTTSAIGNLSAATYSITAGTTFGVTTNGVLTATSGRIGKFNLTNTYLSTGSGSTMAGMGGNQAFWAGNSSSNSAPFRVSYAGVLNATGATLTNLTIKNSATGTPTIGTFDTNGITLYDQAGTQRIKITSSGGVVIGKASGKGRIEVTDSGMNIYNASGTQTSSFGDSITLGSNAATVTIGKVAANNYNTVINNQGMTINDNATPIAQFSSSGARIGKTGVGYIDIKSTGLDIYSGSNNTNLVHLGYDDTKNESSIVKGKYFKFSSPPHEDPDTYNVNNTYTTGDEVYYNNKIYRCIVTQTTGNWNSNNWCEVTNGLDSFNIGYNTCASDRDSFAGGNLASAFGPETFAFGNSCVAYGYGNFAIGSKTLAKGTNSCAFGAWTVSSGDSQMAIGYWNVRDTTQDAYGHPDNIFIIGNGSSESNRSNAFIVNKSGNVKAKGRFYASSNSDSSGGSVVFDAGHTIDTNSTCLPQFSGSPSYLVGIEAFANGGAMKWQSVDSISVGYATRAGSATDSTKLPLAGGTLTGRLTLNTFNTAQVNMRPSHASYDGIMSYQTAGNEAWVFSTKNAVTSFMFVNGEDTVSNASDSRWKSLTPGLQIKNNCVSIGKLIGDGVTPSYKLDVNGTVNFTDLGTNAITATKGLFALTSNTIFSSKTMAAGNVQNSTAVFSKSGYYPLGIAGWSTDSGDINTAQLYLSSKSNDSATVTYIFKNVGSTSRTVTAKVDILWIKYS